VVSEKTCDTLAALLTGVVERGTGSKARIEGFEIAGKTGTSQQYVGGVYSKSDYNASFAGFFPATDPQIALLVVIDRPKGNYYGGATAAPIFRDIAARTISSFEKYIFAGSGEEYELPDSVLVPDVRGLPPEAAEDALDAAELDSDDSNEGEFVVIQNPAPGEFVESGSDVMLTYSAKNIANIDSLRANINLKGLPARRAVAILHSAGAEVKIIGHGRVYKTGWSTKKAAPLCRIYCK
jgi:membrane peptidoglycan carboxypeptidase